MEEFLEWVVQAKTASTQQVVPRLKTEMQKQRGQKRATVVTVTEAFLQHEDGTEQVPQVLRAFNTVQT